VRVSEKRDVSHLSVFARYPDAYVPCFHDPGDGDSHLQRQSFSQRVFQYVLHSLQFWPVVGGAIELLYTPVDRRVQANYLILVEYCPTRLVFGNPLAVTETL